MFKDAIFSEDRIYRYVLIRIWDDYLPKIIFIGLNPSVGDENSSDKTINQCIKYAKSLNYGGIYMLNLYAFVSKNPTKLKDVKNPIGSKNDKYINEYLDKSDIVVCMWENNILSQKRADEILKKIKNPYCFKINKSGQPSHISRLSLNLKLIKFKKIN